ncbi:MAG: ABC transporter substrate-binding protein, partial [Pseudonocardiaceae bacterium]
MTQQRPTRASGRWLGVLATIIALATVAGCGGGDDTSAVPGSPAGGANAGAFPVTITHKFGQTSIPAEPRRVVTVGQTDQDAVLALGVVPVGTTEWYGEYPGALWPWAQEKRNELNGALPTVLPAAEDIEFEQIAALQPDLILALYAGLDQNQYDLLSQIAPTVTQPEGVVDFGIPWDVQTRVVGQALGRSSQAEQLIGSVEKQ